MQGRLLFRNDDERGRAHRLGINDLNRKYGLLDLAHGDVMFAATGVTNGSMLRGVRRFAGGASTHSVVMRSKTGTVRYVEATPRLHPQAALRPARPVDRHHRFLPRTRGRIRRDPRTGDPILCCRNRMVGCRIEAPMCAAGTSVPEIFCRIRWTGAAVAALSAFDLWIFRLRPHAEKPQARTATASRGRWTGLHRGTTIPPWTASCRGRSGGLSRRRALGLRQALAAARRRQRRRADHRRAAGHCPRSSAGCWRSAAIGSRRGAGLSRAAAARPAARPGASARHGAGGRAPGARGPRRRADRRVRRLRCRRRHLGGAAVALFRGGRRPRLGLCARPAARGLRPERAGPAAPARQRARRGGDGRLRRHRA